MISFQVWKDNLDTLPIGISFQSRQLELSYEALADLIAELQLILTDRSDTFYKQINIGVELDNATEVSEESIDPM